MQHKTTGIIATLVLCGAVVFIWWQIKPSGSRFSHAPFVGVGQVLADTVIQAVHGRGRIVVVLPAISVSNLKNMPPNDLWEGFRDELKGHSDIQIVGTELAAMQRTGTPPGFSPAAVKDVWGRHANADAIVFFDGLPFWDDVREQVGRGAAPKLIVVDLGPPQALQRYGEYFASGILTALIGINADPATVLSAPPKTPRELFSQRYQVYTPQNYDTLPNY